MPRSATTIDSHVHLDLITCHHPQRIQWLMENNCGVVSWSYFLGVESSSHLSQCLDAKERCICEQSAAGLACHFLAGVHPRSIPPDLKPEQIEQMLTPYLQNPFCLGIGEIGLETGDDREKEVLIAQLELGRKMAPGGAVVGVHTPRSNKLAITRMTLDILKGFAELTSALVVDHCTVDTIGAVLDAGFWAGVTLSPVKASWNALQRIVAGEPDRVDRIMVNTDSGSAFFEDVVVYRHNEQLPEGIRDNLFQGAAKRFFAFPGRRC